ncbi:ribonuclease P protein subunit p21 isoform A [Alligator mississippiensis]|uniref:Ribonuclease P protein subunit p21 isoform A n=1 Tax=Alligator mississippiensis TaxID=8496 RepID=A0A151M5R7_ALLMI|nr:ribonuclease P protein subunit p21 isoform A [Alligator mississippiensis]
MAGQVKDKEALQRLSFLYQGPIGVSATVRQRRRRRQRWTIVRCLNCGLTKRFLNNPEYKLWAEQPEALLENQPQCDQKSTGLHQPSKEPPAQKGKALSRTLGFQSQNASEGTPESTRQKGKGDAEPELRGKEPGAGARPGRPRRTQTPPECYPGCARFNLVTSTHTLPCGTHPLSALMS